MASRARATCVALSAPTPFVSMSMSAEMVAIMDYGGRPDGRVITGDEPRPKRVFFAEGRKTLPEAAAKGIYTVFKEYIFSFVAATQYQYKSFVAATHFLFFCNPYNFCPHFFTTDTNDKILLKIK